MINFADMHGAVYILENPAVQRVKIGMTINKVADRLNDINDMWQGRKVTCQLCGGRYVNIKGYVPPHKPSGIKCPGGLKLPLEEDVSLAEEFLEKMKNSPQELFGRNYRPDTRRNNNLEKRIELYRNFKQGEGQWQIATVYFTDCAEQVELKSHEILADRLDLKAPFGEVFLCSVSEAIKAVESTLSQYGLLESARKEPRL